MQQDEIRKQVITVIFPGKQIIPFYRQQYISTCTTKETNILSPVPPSARKTAVLMGFSVFHCRMSFLKRFNVRLSFPF